MRYDIITVGSSTIDVFVSTDSEIFSKKSNHKLTKMLAYPLGTKLLIKELNFTTGGGGTNTAVAFSRLNNKTAYLGKIGNDENGTLIKKQLKKEKIDFVGVTGKENSGYSIILDSKAHDRTILTHKGANNNLKFNEINLKKLKTKWFYFSSMVDTSFKTLEKLSVHAKKNNIKVAFNPSSYLTRKGINYLKKIIKNTNILILNKEEASDLVKGKTVEELLKKLTAKGPEIVVITHGKHYVIAFDTKNYHKIKPHNIKIIESTGAGDAFASSFISTLIKNKDIPTALKTGLINAESVITHHGAKNKLLKRNELNKLLNKKRLTVKTY
ncbi:carbohydrate kinase family protein [Candidatus Woesearchaeota archaeon]|nr:carbohydrate kinase family protein [Candidatus Woesearchaeota archaeon]